LIGRQLAEVGLERPAAVGLDGGRLRVGRGVRDVERGVEGCGWPAAPVVVGDDVVGDSEEPGAERGAAEAFQVGKGGLEGEAGRGFGVGGGGEAAVGVAKDRVGVALVKGAKAARSRLARSICAASSTWVGGTTVRATTLPFRLDSVPLLFATEFCAK